MSPATIQTRLCPHCANSIGADALRCPYCKADLAGIAEPQWPERELAEGNSVASDKPKLTVRSKAILVFGLLVFALGIYLVGGNVERHDWNELLASQQQALREKDSKIASLQAELAEVRQKAQTEQSSKELRARLDESQKNLVVLQRKLASANKEIERLSASRAAARATPRTGAPATAQTSEPRPISASQTRTYEAVRSTTVFDQPQSSAKVVTRLTKGTQVTVVGSENGWLEIRSKHGQPPGFIRADDAIFISRAN